ncbi:MAG: multidrug efflux SMR transporter [Nevskiaceae bacterium]|nr:MAG: multidrug efflux SMR transporter [Nevskiaceae bacterium]TBR74438.1 MAG: multidrug efflux SMR transporter [Nevskiaceae bacterium]
MLYNWLLLGLAIIAEVTATSALKASDGFTRPGPVILVVAGYGLAFYLMSVTLRVLPMGVVYAVWSGVGIVLIAAIGWLVFGQRLDLPAVIGIALIIAGVGVLNLASQGAPPPQ